MNLENLMRERPLVGALMAAHLIALGIWTWGAVRRRKEGAAVSGWTLLLALAVNTALLAQMWIEAGRAPFKTLYETLLLYPWCVAAVTLVLIAAYRLTVLVPFCAVVCVSGLVYAAARPDLEIVNLPPALQSVWFVPHVVTYFVAYAALFAAAALAALAVARPHWRSSAGEGFETFAHRSAMFGFSALTLGIVMGAVWGKQAWGDYWSWDPKENWALVTFLAYLVYLHLRLINGWQGRRSMIALAGAFGAVVFTYLGMSLLPSAGESLHVYQ